LAVELNAANVSQVKRVPFTLNRAGTLGLANAQTEIVTKFTLIAVNDQNLALMENYLVEILVVSAK
jgi:hypothetical protein